MHAIKTYEESSKLKFVYPKISDLFLINKEIAHLKHNGILMIGINGGTEAVALSNILDDSGVKNIVLLANNSTCRNLKGFLILEGFSVENVTGECLLSFKKVFFENQIKYQPLASSGAFKSSISGKTFKPIMIKITEIETLPAKDCTPFKLKLINNLT